MIAGRASTWMLALAVVLATLVWAPPAKAHEFGPDIRVVLDPLPEVLEPLTVEIVTSIAPQLAIGNTTDDTLEVLDGDGVGFLRIGPDGVEANFDNGDFYLTQDPLGALAVPERARGDGLPGTWGLLSVDPEWAWFDHRMHPQNVLQLRVPEPSPDGTILSRFELPVSFRGEEVAISGAIVQQPQIGRLVTAIEDVPPIDGVSVQLLPGGTPGIFMTATEDRDVVVLGREGEPFLHFTNGRVEANTRSPSWYDSGRAPRFDADDAPVLDPGAEPVWEVVSTSPRYGWIETRGLYGRGTADQDLQSAGVDTDLVDWNVPILVDGERFEVAGITRFEVLDEFRDEGPTGLALWVPIGLGVAGLAVIAVVLGRRRRAGD